MHPHLAEPCPEGRIRVDCHLHTMYSGDAVTTLDELAEGIAAAQIDVACVTDHNAVAGALAAIERDVGCRIIVGEEIRTGAGEIIGLFLCERIPYGIDVRDAVARVREQGGVVYVPHPFDPLRHAFAEAVFRELCAEGAVDAVEGFNAKVGLDHMNDRAVAAAAEFSLPAGAGSDAHDGAAIGAAYVEMPDFDGPADFLDKLHDGHVIGHRFDRPRSFTPRIIPGGLRQT
ncbi:MAG: PHP domain-containing protein [Actinobacteria bacterium]|nr:PHP domain-containing protein [Actinomycetota bacterium]